MYTLDQARAFIAVAEELHFGRAAQRLAMTQPPLSRQIQKLEKSIGVQLLERDNRTVELTVAGRAFLAEARKLVVAADRAPAMARRIAAGSAGVLRIGFTATSGYGMLGRLLAELDKELPDVDVELAELVTVDQVRALLDGELDLGLARPPFDTAQFGSTLVSTEELRLVVPAGHPLAGLGRPVAPRQLADVDLVMYSPATSRYFHDLVVRLLPAGRGNVVHTVSQIATMVSLVAAGRGVALVPESAQVLGIPGVAYLPLADHGAGRVELHALWNRESRNPALVPARAVIDKLAGTPCDT